MKFFRLIFSAVRLWINEGADNYASSLAYYTLFALTPLLLLSITLAGFIIGQTEVVTLLLRWGNIINPEVSNLLDTSVQNFNSITTTYYVPMAAIIFFSTVVIVAFNTISRGFDALWHIEINGWLAFMQRSFRSALFVLLLQIYLVLLIIFNDSISYLITKTGLLFLNQISQLLFLASTILLLTIGYGLLPLRAPGFFARLAGATVASFLFFFTREIVFLYIGTMTSPSLFGTAGIIVLLLVWVYISASILFYGAAFAQVYQNSHPRR